MKNYVLLLDFLVFFSSCNNNDDALDINDPEFLMYKIYGLNNFKATYEYNANNDPIFLNIDDCIFYNYEYDNNGILKAIYAEHIIEGESKFSEYQFTYFNENGCKANYVGYDPFTFSSEGHELELEFDGNLVKSIKTTYLDGIMVKSNFHHDMAGRLTEITQENNLIGAYACDLFLINQYTIESWEDNVVPSQYSVVRNFHCLPFSYFLFPNYYFSTKNPKKIIPDNYSNFVNGYDINLVYEYDDNGNTVMASDSSFYQYKRVYIDYIEAN